MTINAAVLFETGKPLEIEEAEALPLGAADVRVQLAYSGICHSDLSVQHARMAGYDMRPIVPGHEGAGVVVEAGPAVGDVAVGDHVILAQIAPCGRCPVCLRGEPIMCPHARAQRTAPRLRVRGLETWTMTGLGTFAEEAVVPQGAAIRIDDDVPLDVACLIGCGVVTGSGAVFNESRVTVGSSVVVIGCGGVGMNVVQAARIAGAAEILAVDVFPEKLDAARRFGASHTATPEELPDAIRDITGGAGFDFAFEVLGRPDTVRAAFNATRHLGTLNVIGLGPGMMDLIPADRLGYKHMVRGATGSGHPRTEFARLIRLWRAGRLDLEGLVSEEIRLDDVNRVLDAMEAGDYQIRTLISYA
jgi:S-(hydroxymethyl)glutathione dehydrogenase/alcohol dehydrogenase